MNIPALMKIAALTDEERAWIEGQLEARQQFNKELNESAGNIGASSKLVGFGGGLAGAGLTAKGIQQMISKGPAVRPAGFKSVYSQGLPYGGTKTLQLMDLRPTGAITAAKPHFAAIVPKPKIAPRIQGRNLAIKGGLLGLGSIGAGIWLDHLADKHRSQAQKHENAGQDLTMQLGK